ncbi:MAG: sulfotransferase domain-containing protein, partial [Thermodesulfovibrio sp.]|nr:sulfotransferase domain-containing protein [Thermodesulfovibrio sp.]
MALTCLLILGMHRSGTSALAGILHILGISIGKILLPPAPDNPKGFFENEKITLFNELKLLPMLNTYWHDIRPIGINEILSIRNDLRTEAYKILEEEYKNVYILGIKDPRMCIVLPFWEDSLLKFANDIKIIIPYRNPLEVAYSLHYRDRFSIGKGLFLWAKHVLFGEYYSRKYHRIFINLNLLFENPISVLKEIIENLEIPLKIDLNKFKNQIEKFLEKRLRHYYFSLEHLPNNTPMFIKDLAFWMEELSLSRITDCKDVRERFDFWRNEYEKSYKNYFSDYIGNNCSLQLYIDDGYGFRESLSFIKNIEPIKNFQEIIFDFDKREIFAKALRLDPLNSPCICNIKNISVIDKDGREIKLEYSETNAYKVENNKFIFYTCDPQIIFKEINTLLKQIKVILNFDTIENELIKTVN